MVAVFVLLGCSFATAFVLIARESGEIGEGELWWGWEDEFDAWVEKGGA